MNPIVLVSLISRAADRERKKRSDQPGPARAHALGSQAPRSEQTPRLCSSHITVFTRLFPLCAVYQMGPRVPMEARRCNAALYSVLLCLQFASPKNSKCQSRRLQCAFRTATAPAANDFFLTVSLLFSPKIIIRPQ